MKLVVHLKNLFWKNTETECFNTKKNKNSLTLTLEGV